MCVPSKEDFEKCLYGINKLHSQLLPEQGTVYGWQNGGEGGVLKPRVTYALLIGYSKLLGGCLQRLLSPDVSKKDGIST